MRRALAGLLWLSPAVALALPYAEGGGEGRGALAAPAETMPYRLWWSYPVDDTDAIELDEAAMRYGRFPTRWSLALDLRRCRSRTVHAPVGGAGGPVLREVRVEEVGAGGDVRRTTRCVLTLEAWQKRLGAQLVERLEDELDAHVSFLHPRSAPTMPPPSSSQKKPEGP